MSDALLLILIIGAVHRITRFICFDDFPPIAAFRAWVDRNVEEKWALLVTCPWCMSIYVSAGVVLALVFAMSVSVPLPVLVWLTASGATGMLASRTES